jgi:Protein of unknown function (DUF2911)
MFKKKSNKRMVLVVVFVAFLVSQHLPAQQLNLPRTSPSMKVVGTIGISKVAVKYSSPQVKGREVWGKLVPYGLQKFGFGSGNPAPWRAGANENTIIWFSDDVTIEGKPLAAGSYGLHMIPSENDWVIIFSKNTSSWGSYFYFQEEDALRVSVKPVKAPFREWLVYGIENFTKNSADVYLHWEKLKVKFSVNVDAGKLVLKSIENQLRGAIGFSWQAWNQAAFFALRSNSFLSKGIEWSKKSIKMNENATNRNTMGYLLMADKKSDEAIKLFRETVKKYPKNWNVHDSLAENLVKLGKIKEGIKYYKLALKTNPPDGQKKRINKTIKKLQEKK